MQSSDTNKRGMHQHQHQRTVLSAVAPHSSNHAYPEEEGPKAPGKLSGFVLDLEGGEGGLYKFLPKHVYIKRISAMWRWF